jgi:2-oxoglutarate ferredoxin oxidoreductase subunit alpha
VFSIPTLPSEFKDELRRHIDRKGLGNRIGDFLEDARKAGIHVYTVPYMDLLKRVAAKLGIEKLSKVTRMINVLTIGISFSLLRYDYGLVEKAVRATFSTKPKVADMNIVALAEAYNYAEQTFKQDFPHKLETAGTSEERIFISGNQAVAIGKVLGGCRIQTYYPITPAADESEYLEAHEILKTKVGDGAIIVIQTEDEIAAINSASGAALTGARAATSTSGPGFSLMVEGLSWAGNSEVPVVITYYQRGAPSTGLPTRFGQADMRFVMHAGHGEFPRIVLASGDIKECFYDAAQAFNYAERYQLPVIHLVDKAMANSSQTYKIFDTAQFKIERGAILEEAQIKTDPFKRFSFAESGISPRVFVGAKNSVHWHTGDEHDEVGHISEEPLNRDLMMEKRMKKLETVDKGTPSEEKVNFFGDKNSKNIVVSWGSPKGAIVEALNLLKREGFSLAFIQIRMLLPFPKEYIANTLKSAERIIDVENNYLGQLGGIIREETGISPHYYILKYNGRPMTTTEIYDALKNILLDQASERQVLKYGS